MVSAVSGQLIGVSTLQLIKGCIRSDAGQAGQERWVQGLGFKHTKA